jgi:hypothetical protein
MSAMCHVCTAPSWQGESSRRRLGRCVRRSTAAKNGSVTSELQTGGLAWKDGSPMTVIMVMVCEILAAFALGFVIGRIWQIRRDELQGRVGFTVPPVARIPRPSDAEHSGQAAASAARSADLQSYRPERSAKGAVSLASRPKSRDPAGERGESQPLLMREI